jgi:hypothetical protein
MGCDMVSFGANFGSRHTDTYCTGDRTDPSRAEWHARKLASKDTSAAAHISNIGLTGSPTLVEHVQLG